MNHGPVIFTERQLLGRGWIGFFILGFTAITCFIYVRQVIFGHAVGNQPASNGWVTFLFILFCVLLPIFLCFAYLQTTLRREAIAIRFFPFHLREKRFPYQNLANIEVTDYRPLRDYGGWGIRYGKQGKAYTISGHRGLLLTFKSGKQLLIGSQNPEALLKAIQEAQSTYSSSSVGRA